MSLTVYQGSGQKPGGPGENQEPESNFYTKLVAATCYVNLACFVANILVKDVVKNENSLAALFERVAHIKIPKEFVKSYGAGANSATMVAIIALNIPLRTIGIYKALQEKKYLCTAAQVVAFASLFFPFPYGRAISLTIDCASGLYNLCGPISIFPTAAPKPRKRVIKPIIEIPDTTDPENAAKILSVTLESGREDIVKIYKSKIQGFSTKMDGKSSIDEQLELCIKRDQSAYRTLISRLEHLSPGQKDPKPEPRTIDFKAACEILEIENGLHSDRQHIVKKYQTKIHDLSEKMDGTSSSDDQLQLMIEEVQVAYDILVTELTDWLASPS